MTEEEAAKLEAERLLKLKTETETLEKDQKDQPISEERFKTLENVLLEERAERQKLQEQIAQLTKKPELTPAEKDKKFYESPTSELDAIVAKQIAPLKDFIGELKAGTALDQARALVKKDAKFSKVFEVAGDEIEEAISRLPKDLSKQDLEASIRGIARGVAGAVALGELGDKKLGENKVNDKTPAHLRPSPAHFSKREDGEDKIEMTEEERFLAKKQGISEEEWVSLRDADSRSFVHASKKKEK